MIKFRGVCNEKPFELITSSHNFKMQTYTRAEEELTAILVTELLA